MLEWGPPQTVKSAPLPPPPPLRRIAFSQPGRKADLGRSDMLRLWFFVVHPRMPCWALPCRV